MASKLKLTELLYPTSTTAAITINSDDSVTIPTQSTTNLAYTGTLTGGTGVVNLGSGQFYKDASGNVGIGTTTPDNALTIQDSGAGVNKRFSIRNGDSTNSHKLTMGYNAGALSGFIPATSVFITGETNGGFGALTALSIGTISATPIIFGTSNTESMRILSGGNVGIGTTAPNAKLELSLVSNPGGPGFYGGANNLLLFAAAGSGYGEPAVKFQEQGCDVGAVIAGKNTANGAMAIVFANRDTSSTTSTLTEKMRIDQDGNMLVGTTSTTQSARLNVTRDNTTGGNTTVHNIFNSACTSTTKQANILIRISSNASSADTCINLTDNVSKNYFFGGNNGGAYVVANSNGVRLAENGTSWASDSDERVKDIIEPITNAAQKVSTLRAVIGKYKTDAKDTRRAFLIAQDVQAVLPEAVFDEQGTLMLSYTDVIPLLTAAIQEQQALITQLQADVATLKGAA
jgi:hypothetical protein